MIALGIDCATKAGWARIEFGVGRERMLGHGVLNLKDSGAAWQQIAYLTSFPGPPADVVAIELPYVAKNVDTAIKLALLAGQFRQAFGPTGASIELVRASQWQAAILGPFGGNKRESRKKAAILWARAMFGVALTEDQADATGLAVWASRFMRPETHHLERKRQS